MPKSRPVRITLGSVLVLFGTFGFLPLVGYWMIPLGLLILSFDIPWVRRKRRKLEVWWGRRRQRRADARQSRSQNRADPNSSEIKG